MAQTILDVLCKPNPALDSGFVTRGSNTYNSDWVGVSDWRPWKDFTYDNLISIYKKLLNGTWKTAPHIEQTSPYDVEIRDEHSMDLFLNRFVFPIVNAALLRASEVERSDEKLYLAPGSWTGSMDWGLVSRHRMTEDGNYYNLLPGDTKLSAKWHPSMERSLDEQVRYQWTLPVSQVITYAVSSGSRYAFIISDGGIALLRVAKEEVSHGIALDRLRRQPSSHQRIASAESDISAALDVMSLDSFSAQSYCDDNPINIEYQPPEYVFVPWDAHGKGRLNIMLSLFCLCRMAASGGSEIDVYYPPLDSWRQVGRLFCHNTSGLTTKHLPKGALVVNPRASTWPAGDQVQEEISGAYAEDEQDAEEEYEEYEEDDEEGEAVLHVDGEHETISEAEGHKTQASASIDVSSSSKGKRVVYAVELKQKGGQIYFRDKKGEKRITTKSDWVRTENGWEFMSKKHVYFVEHLLRGM